MRLTDVSHIWDLFQDKHMFDGRDPAGKYTNRYHLAEMIAYMGPPPVEFLERSEASRKFFDAQGQSARRGGREARRCVHR